MLIKTKTLIGSTLIGATAALITGITIGYLSSMKAGDAVETQVKNQLKSIRDAKKAQIEDYITNIEAQVVDLALSPTVTDYLPDFTRGFNEVLSTADPYSKISQSQNASEFYSNVFGEVYREKNGQLPNEIETVYQGFNPAALALQDVYIYENPHPLGSKNSLADANLDSLYHNTHAHAHPHLQHFLESFGYYDVFLTDNAGNVVYSVFKEADYATSLTYGPFSDSGLANAYRGALELEAGEFYIDDFQPYTPSYENPAAFISSPVFKNGERLGTLIFQFPVDRINDIMTFDHKWKSQGMGDTGEVILVGEDSKPRSELRQQTQYHDKFIDDLKTSGYDDVLIETIDRLGTSVGYLPLELPVVTAALSGKSGVYSVQGLGDERLVAAYTSLDIKGIKWGLIASFNESEAFAAKESLVNTIMLTVLIVVAVVCAIAAAGGQVFAQQIINPLALLGSTVSQMASRNSGSNQTDLPHSDDEIGDIFKALGTLVNRLEDDAKQQATIAAANGRIREALDVSSACVLVADSDTNVIFANKAVSELFAKRQSELESAISGFNAHDLKDLSLPTFFTDKNASENVLKNLTSEYNDRLEYAGATFDIVVIPVINQGELTGYVMQWRDITAELAIEKEVQSLVSKASNGDLSERLNESDKTGFYARLSKDLNELLNVTEDALEDIASLLSNLASGDLTTEISRTYNGTFGQIIDDANRSLSRLTEVVGDISSSSDQIATGASEIAQANFSLQSRTESQAAALEETANNVLQLNDAVKVSHSQAEKVNTVVQSAAKKAEEGGESVRDVIDSMEMIRNSSTEISNIISVINEIAFQTNVLALNAAVEAARAGEEGRGFAVVAGEVRMLAQRSAKAAGEIKGLIEDSVSKVHNGVERVNVSGEVLQELIGAMKEVRSLADQVSSASQQQYEDIQQVSGSVEELKNGTNQNAAMVEELAATTQNMADQASDGKKAISFFTVDKVTSSAI